MLLFCKDVVKGMWRNKKELLLLISVGIFSVLFVIGTLLFQHNATNYTRERNKYVYGDWTVAEIISNTERQKRQLEDHPYFAECGMAVSGLSMVDGDGNKYAYSLGWVDDTMLEIGNITLREGRFPENEKEIVVETGVLTELGYSFELGQEITLFMPEDSRGNGRMETFELVGILKGSMSFWNVGTYMPNILVTENALEGVYFRAKYVYCYSLKEQYEKADVEELYQNLNEAYKEMKNTGWKLFFNSSLYTGSFWESTELYKSVEKIVLVMGMAAMSFLLTAYIQKRKKYYYDLRIIGLSKLRVKLVTFWELVCACVPGVVIGIPLGVFLGLAICGGLTAAKNIGWFYEVPLSVLWKAFWMWLFIFAVAALVSMLITGGRRLYSGKQTVSLRFLPRFCLNKLRPHRKYSSLFIRECRVFRLRNLMGSVVSILFATLLMFCGTELWSRYDFYVERRGELPDFRYNITSEEYKETGEYVWTYENYDYVQRSPYSYGDKWISKGFSGQFLPLLQEISGIKSYSYSVMDNTHLFEWEQMQEDPYIINQRNEVRASGRYIDNDGNPVDYVNSMNQVLPENSLHFGYNGWYVQDTKKIYNLYQEAWGNEWMDYDAFDAGEQVFLICNEPGLLISPGDSLWITAGEEKIEVLVAAVIPQSEVLEAYYPSTFSLAQEAATNNQIMEYGGNVINRNLYLVGSEQLAKTIAKAENTEFHYNWIDLYINPSANYNLTIKQCTDLLATEGAKGNTYYEVIQTIYGEWINYAILYGMFFLMLIGFFLILRANFVQSGFVFHNDRMRRLRMLGMEKRQLRKMNLLQGLYEARWSFLAIPLVYGVKIYQYVQSITEKAATGQWGLFLEETGAISSDVKEILKYRWDDQVALWVCLAVLVVVVALHVLTRYLVARGAIADLDKKEQEG